MADLPTHRLELALIHPQIAPNTGNVARLCVGTGTRLHLVRPMGFVLDDRRLRRSAMDYWPRLGLTVHDDLVAFSTSMKGRRLWLFEPSGAQTHWETNFNDDDVLVFGSESRGLPRSMLSDPEAMVIRVPQVSGERCLNLATSCGIALYEAIRRVQETGRTGSYR